MTHELLPGCRSGSCMGHVRKFDSDLRLSGDYFMYSCLIHHVSYPKLIWKKIAQCASYVRNLSLRNTSEDDLCWRRMAKYDVMLRRNPLTDSKVVVLCLHLLKENAELLSSFATI